MTRQEIEAHQTAKGGYTKAQLAEWGVPWPPPKGWKAALPDVLFAEAFEALRKAVDDVFTGPEESETLIILRVMEHLARQGFEVRRKKGVLRGSDELGAGCAGGGNVSPIANPLRT